MRVKELPVLVLLVTKFPSGSLPLAAVPPKGAVIVAASVSFAMVAFLNGR